MDLASLRAAAEAALPADAWAYYQGTADGRADPERDARAWERWELVPRVMTGLTSVDTAVELGGQRFAAPILIAPSASQGGAHPDAEFATVRAAASAGLLMTYSNYATVDVERFAAAATSPWWAQVYLQRDRALTADYAARCVAGGASALVLTVDLPGLLADAAFRRVPLTGALAVRGNVPPSDAGVRGGTDTSITPEDLAGLVAAAGVPVWVKGVLHPDDAVRALDAGAAGVMVSNHGRRQVPGVVPVAAVLREIVEAVDGRAPVIADGGIRSGADVVRALALGAAAVGIGRPVLWALAAGGPAALEGMLAALVEETAATLAGVGAARVADLRPETVRPAF